MAKTRIVRRYVGEYPLVRYGKPDIKPGQFISKAIFDALPKGDTIEQEIRCGRS
jgi:hypothetical protein